MSKYVAGPSVLRFPGRPAIVPGQAFEHVYDEAAHEALALASGAISLQPGETTLSDQLAAQRAAQRATEFERLAAVSAKPVPAMLTPGEIVLSAAQQSRVTSVIPGSGQVAKLVASADPPTGDDGNHSGPAGRRRTLPIDDKKEQA